MFERVMKGGKRRIGERGIVVRIGSDHGLVTKATCM